MKLLIYSDLHEDLKALEEIKKKAIKHKPDYIIDCGDMSIFGHNLKNIMKKINKLPAPVFTLPGNHESKPQLLLICKSLRNIKYIHKKIIIKQDFAIVGYGGGGFAMIDKKFDIFINKIKSKLRNKKIILITHGPPYGTKLDLIHGNHAGNKSYTNFIKKYKPIIAVSGHLHENAKQTDKIGPTKLIHPGWDGEIIEVQ